MDCFAVALGISCSGKSVPRTAMFKVACAFGVAQAAMALIGWLTGRVLIDVISKYDHWVVFGLLLLVGVHMIWEALRGAEEGGKLDFTRGWTLIFIAVVTSIDALATGLALSIQGADIAAAAPIIGVITFLVVLAGFAIGGKFGEMLGKRAGVLGGLVLIGIGTMVLIEHLSG